MGIEFLKKKNDNYQRRRQRVFERELRQGSIFRRCPPSTITKARATLLASGTATVGELLWAKMGTAGGKMCFCRGGTEVAELPSSLLGALSEGVPTDDEIIAKCSLSTRAGRGLTSSWDQ